LKGDLRSANGEVANGEVANGDVVELLAEQPTHRSMAAFLRRHPELRDSAFVERLYDQVVRVARVDIDRAARLADAAAWLAEQLDDRACSAQSLRASGHVLMIRGRYAEALDHYDRALSLFRALGRDLDVGRTLNGALHSRIYLGQYDEAVATAEEARAIFERHGDRLRLARLDCNIGNIRQRQNQFREALTLYSHARETLMAIGEPQDVAAALINIAVCQTGLHEFSAALAAYDAARRYCDEHGMPLLVAQADYNIAYLHYLHGEYTRALDLYRDAQAQAERVGDAYHRALCDLDRSEIYLELNLTDEAADLADRALASFTALGVGYEAGKALTNLALASSRSGRVDRALDQFKLARELFAREGNDVRLALVDFCHALVLYGAGQHDDARRLAEEARARFVTASLPDRAAQCELLLARLALDAHDLDGAERTCAAALERAGAAESPVLTYHAHFVLSAIQEARGDLNGALQAADMARASLDRLRGHLVAEDLKIAFLKDKLGVYESLVSLCLAASVDGARLEAAFGYIEQAKSRSLADLIAFRAASLTPRVESGLGDEVRALREEVDWNYRQIEHESLRDRSSRRLEQLTRRTRVLESRLAQSLSDIRSTDEDFAALQGAAPLGLADIRAAIPPGTLLLEYFEARDLLYACVLTADRLDIVPLTSASAMRRVLRLLQFQLSKFVLGSEYTDMFARALEAAANAHLQELFEMLVRPIRDRLDARHLVIVPHGALHHVPFHALGDGARALIDEFTISYAPSASVFRLCATKLPPAVGEPLVMGIPDAAAPHIADEVDAVAAAWPGASVFVGDEATLERLRHRGAGSRMVHIATHGRFRADNPMFSSIRLGSGSLSVFDLYQLRIAADLVTLSGCSTGWSAIEGGDELLGLVRGLLYAGARSVLLTLWDVHDRSTAEFMSRFYRELHAGTGKAAAFRSATLAVRETRSHPFYWAPFVLVGEPGVNV
jgi:CHAT domain-containing protein